MSSARESFGDRGGYLDPALPVADRIADLLSRMTLEEKTAQLGSAWVFELLAGDEFSAARAEVICRNGLGQVSRIAGASSLTPGEAARVANDIQRHLVERTRLGIPAIVHEEICSGVMSRGSTVYPQAIGVASTFDPDLNEAIARSIRLQMRRVGTHQGLSPVLDVTRDPRWGRTEETYGEDPYLVSRMGTSFVAGLQGDDLTDGVIATAKHFVGYGASEGGMNWAPAHIGPRELREVFLHPFEAAIRDANVRSVMNGYHEIDGIPCAANSELMVGLLRETWGFDGIVVSDYFSVDQLAVYHHLASDKEAAAALGLNSGIDVELPSTDCYAGPLLAAIAGGEVGIDTLDNAVRRVLRLKFELGLFEEPYVDEATANDFVNTVADQDLAAEIARKSIVLLRNDGILPLVQSTGTIAVIGPNAHSARNLLGDYAYPAHIESLVEMRDRHNVFNMRIPDDVTFERSAIESPTILEAIREKFDDVRYALGCHINDEDRTGFEEAVALAEEADVVIMVLGDKAGLTLDCTSGEGRDRSSLDLPGVQEELARAVIATGTPVISVLVVGRPCGSELLHTRSSAVVLVWLPGQEGGAAAADVISGDYNPGGKLPISFPRSVGQLPLSYGHKVSGGRSHWQGDYVDGPTSPLYPFGFGLSYAHFRLDGTVLETRSLPEGGSVRLSTELTNLSDRAGEEVIQVYTRDLAASVTRPVLELKSFARVSVEPGESRKVGFEIPIGQLGFFDADLEYVIERGDLEVLVGTSSRELVSLGHVSVTAVGPVERTFDGTRSIH
jgi:beta-glucosidase